MRRRVAIASFFCVLWSAAGPALAGDVELRAAGPISLGYVGMYYGLVDPANGLWHVGSGWGGSESKTWLAVADTGASACILGVSTQDAYTDWDGTGIPMQLYPDVRFGDEGFGGSVEFAVTHPVRMMIADFKTADLDPDNTSLYTAYGQVGGPLPPSMHMAAALEPVGGLNPDVDIIGMSIMGGRLLHVDPHYLQVIRLSLFAMAGSLAQPEPSPSDPRAVYLPVAMEPFFVGPQPVEVGEHAMLGMSIRRGTSGALATRTAIFDTGSPVNFVCESFATEAGIDIDSTPELTVPISGVGGGGPSEAPGWYVDTLALEMGNLRCGDRLNVRNTAVFTIPDEDMPGGLDAVLGNGAFSPSAGLADTPVVEWYVDTRDAENAFITVIMPTPATSGGDANLDGDVDVIDLVVLANHFDTPAGADWVDGDFNADGAVDVLDLAILANNFQYASGGAECVPEPASAALLAVGLAALLIRRRRTRPATQRRVAAARITLPVDRQT